MILGPLLDVKTISIRVLAGLSLEERFARTGCITSTKWDDKRREAKSVPTVDLGLIIPKTIVEDYDKEIYLVRLNLYLLTWQVLSQLYQHGFEPICYEEMAALSEQHPDVHFVRHTVSIVESATGRGTFGYVSLSLNGDWFTKIQQRTFISLACGDGIGANCWFAVSPRRIQRLTLS